MIEKDFSKEFIKYLKQAQYDFVFSIETEETIKGFPDIMAIQRYKMKNITDFYELKVDKGHGIKFQPSQFAFNRENKNLNVRVSIYHIIDKKIFFVKFSDILKINKAQILYTYKDYGQYIEFEKDFEV